METLRDSLGNHGLPFALYSDSHSIFRVNNPEREGELTQFTRAIKTLGIAPIHATPPQEKGRVERANQTLQDRLVREQRLRNISDIETANAWLLAFVKPTMAALPLFPVKGMMHIVKFITPRKN